VSGRRRPAGVHAAEGLPIRLLHPTAPPVPAPEHDRSGRCDPRRIEADLRSAEGARRTAGTGPAAFAQAHHPAPTRGGRRRSGPEAVAHHHRFRPRHRPARLDPTTRVPTSSPRPSTPTGAVNHTSHRFGALAEDLDVRLPVGRKGQRRDNAVAESSLATIKTELLNRQPRRTRTRAHKATFEYIERWYNTRRLHSSLGYLSPAPTKPPGTTWRSRWTDHAHRNGSTPVVQRTFVGRGEGPVPTTRPERSR
jgi:hypothetical protein